MEHSADDSNTMHGCSGSCCARGAEGAARNLGLAAGLAASLAAGLAAAWRALLAEGCGAALLVALSCAAPAAAPAAHRALASGLVVTILVQSLDHISGAQLNPTVTLASVVWGRLGPALGLLYVAAQLAGASLGALALPALGAARPPCVTLPADRLALYQAVCVEAAGGACLALVNCASWDARNAALRDSWPLRIGLTVAGLTLVAGELTGASFNPARSFGPALCAAHWTHHWVYWLGPLGGSLAAALLYVCAWRAPPSPPPPPPPSPPSPPATKLQHRA